MLWRNFRHNIAEAPLPTRIGIALIFALISFEVFTVYGMAKSKPQKTYQLVPLSQWEQFKQFEARQKSERDFTNTFPTVDRSSEQR